MIEITRRDVELGVLLEEGMTEAQVSAEREICEIVRLLSETPDPEDRAALEARLRIVQQIRGPRVIRGEGHLKVPASVFQDMLNKR